MLMQIEQLKDEREDLLQKAVNLKQNMRTMKSELVQRENIADSLKRQNRELRLALNMQASGKDVSMYAPAPDSATDEEGGRVSGFESGHLKSRSAQKAMRSS